MLCKCEGLNWLSRTYLKRLDTVAYIGNPSTAVVRYEAKTGKLWKLTGQLAWCTAVANKRPCVKVKGLTSEVAIL